MCDKACMKEKGNNGVWKPSGIFLKGKFWLQGDVSLEVSLVNMRAPYNVSV